MGVVEEIGADVTAVSRGDRVVIPFTISCGDCFFCEEELFSACENTNPSRGTIVNAKKIRSGAGLFGFTHLYGGYPGGQAEYVRVPKANVGPLKIPKVLMDEQVLFLSDILPTGYQAAVNAGVKPGSTVAIFGAGPVGMMAAASARLLGAERIFMIDHHQYRLDFARATYGVEAINFDEVDDPAQHIVSATNFRGVDASIDAVGFEAKGSTLETTLTMLKLEGSSGVSLRQAIAATRRGGTVSVPGIYTGPIHGFLFGDAFEKGLKFAMGQTHVQQHMPALLKHIEEGHLDPGVIISHRLPLSRAALKHIEEGHLDPGVIISHRLPLSRAAEGYKMFDEKHDDCRKVVLVPD